MVFYHILWCALKTMKIICIVIKFKHDYSNWFPLYLLQRNLIKWNLFSPVMLPKNPSKLKKKALKQEDVTLTIKRSRPKFSNSRFSLISHNCHLGQSSDKQPVLAVKDVPDYIVSTARSKHKTLAERVCGTCAVPLPVPETNTKQSTHGQSVATGILKMSPRRTAGRNCHFFRMMSSQETSCAFFRMTVEPLKPVWAQQRVEALFKCSYSAHVPTNFDIY